MEYTTKICTKCNCEKELTEFYFRKTMNTYYNDCKICKRKYAKENHDTNKENSKIVKKQYYENNKDKIIESRKKTYLKNKDKINQKKKEWYYNNLDKAKEKRDKYYEENKEKLLIQKKEYYNNNKEKIKQKAIQHYHNNIETSKERHKKYIEKNKESYLAKKRLYNKTDTAKLSSLNSTHKRKAIIKNGDVTTQQLKELYQNTKNCYWCDCKLEKGNIHLDHYVALSKGGTHSINNLVLSCPTCNMQKYNKDPIEFAKQKGKLF